MTKIYESPDNGSTIYARNFGESERTIIKSNIEKCVLCESDTEYLVTDHIDNRLHYIEGAGQLCGKCYKAVNDPI